MPAVPKPSHARRVPKKGKRGQFDKKTRERIIERDKGLCQMCLAKAEEIHHIFFRSRGGRGVYTNGISFCHICHRKVHDDAELADYWIHVFVDRYGPNFYKDEWDL